MRVWLGSSLLFWSVAVLALSGPGSNNGAAIARVSAAPPIIVIGFVGGFVKHDNFAHEEVQLAQRLRDTYHTSAYARIFENHHRRDAYHEIRHLLDTDHNQTLSPDERKRARIIIYGHSWGASETVALARQLNKDGIPVLLTVQVDSVNKPGEKDDLVPPNVAQAINFYQPDGWIHGRSRIRAASPDRTQILGNFRMDYKQRPVACGQYPWFAKPFMKTHLEIECDPAVWNQIESLIRSQMDGAGMNNSRQIPQPAISLYGREDTSARE